MNIEKRFSFKGIVKLLSILIICGCAMVGFNESIFSANGDTYGVNTSERVIVQDHNGNYHSESWITVSNYNADGTVTVTLKDIGYSTNGAYNYWTGDGLIYVDGKYIGLLDTQSNPMKWYGTNGYNSGYKGTVSLSFKLAQGKTYTVEQRNRVYGSTVESGVSYKIYVSVPAQTYTATMNHYKRNATNTAWTHFQTTSQTVTRGTTFTPSFVSVPTGYYASSYNTWTEGYGTNLGSGAITMPGSNVVTELYYYPNNYYLDLNGSLNGAIQGNTSPMGTADVYVNGICVANDVSDYYSAHPYGSTYEIKDIKSNTGYTYIGLSSYSGTITGNTSVVPSWNINTYTNTISHWAWGFKNGEGNNGDSKTAFNLAYTYFNKNYNASYTLSVEDAVTIPNGYYLNNQFVTGSLSTDGTWHAYDLGYTGTQPTKNLSFEYDYYPITYSITYELNGGSIQDLNYPTTYNILYGVSFPTSVTRQGYIFDGWEFNGEKITGINVNVINVFDSVDIFYQEMSKRKTGNITVSAKWKKVSEPSIDTKNQYFFKDEIVSSNDLLKKTVAFDEVDGNLSDKVEIVSMMYPNGSIVTNPTYLNTENIGKVKVTYRCENSNHIKCEKSAYAIIVDKYGKIISDHKKIYVRFIDFKYLNTLAENSIWKKEDYGNVLRTSLMKDKNKYLTEYEWINET